MKTLESLSLHIAPLLLVLALAVATSLSSEHAGRAPQASYTQASSTAATPRTPYGSGAAMRALLY